MAETLAEIDYDKLASAIALKFPFGEIEFAANDVETTGAAKITSDDCTNLKFSCGGKDFMFAKAGKDSWVETVKHSHRNGTQIDVIHGPRITTPSSTYLPKDIHDH